MFNKTLTCKFDNTITTEPRTHRLNLAATWLSLRDRTLQWFIKEEKNPTVPESIPHSRLLQALHGTALEVLSHESPESRAAKNLELFHQTITWLTVRRN